MVKITHQQLDEWRRQGGQDLVLKKLKELPELEIVELQLTARLLIHFIEKARDKKNDA